MIFVLLLFFVCAATLYNFRNPFPGKGAAGFPGMQSSKYFFP